MTKVKSSWEIEENAKYFLESERGAVPGSDLQLEIMVSIIQQWRPAPSRILDLGCGDGILGRFMITCFASVEAIFVDFSDPMLDAARASLKHISNSTILKADFSSEEWLEALEPDKSFDVIISGFAIHHQPDNRKKELYSEIYNLLTPGGVFLNLEHVESSTPEVSKLFEEYFIEHLHNFQLKSNPETSKEIVADGFRNRPDKDEDQLVAVETQCEWLREIGFKDVDCFFKHFEIGLFGGRKK
ncbi:MAG: class I SAM-dependent methyltransferase [Thermodesulfobacteriota bacterium]